MPFLLAEILNFQGSTHRIGVGSFSYFRFFTCLLDRGLIIDQPGAYFYSHKNKPAHSYFYQCADLLFFEIRILFINY